MTIPDYQTIMLPLLQLHDEGQDVQVRDGYAAMAMHFELSDEDREHLLPSGKMRVINNRTGWSKMYLVRAGLLEPVRRGVTRITEGGRELLAKRPDRIDNSLLRQFPEFIEFLESKKEQKSAEISGQQIDELQTPDEMLEHAHEVLRSALASEILDQVKQASPTFFERLVVDLLVGMGYGGSVEDPGKVVGKSHDGGIDGIIKEDGLGLDVIYIQAKRWENIVGRPDIQKFVGALQGQRARKGVFITTSNFSQEAQEYANSIENKIVLIDGRRLAELMIRYDVGVSPIETYIVKRLDMDYFDEE